MKAKETIIVDSERVGCDGGDGPMGHPRVFLSLADKPAIDCPYCGRRFTRGAETATGAH
jgi:uncharacterized Zn-finger protein